MFKVFLCVATEHNRWLVALAALVCLPATFATFFLYSKVPSFPDWRRWIWLAMTGLVAGSGIWTTHFVAMLAFNTGLPTGYTALPTMGSLAVAIFSTTLGFAVGSARVGRPDLTAVTGGLIVGLGITFMHYVGMAGYRTTGFVEWNPTFVAASIATGAAFAALALYFARPGSRTARQALGGSLLSFGIVAMHFTGMTAITIIPDPGIIVPPSLMSDGTMAFAAVVVTVLILLTATGGVAFDTYSRNANLRRLRESLDVMPEGLAFYDASDRLIAWNARYGDLCRAFGVTLADGMTFEEILRSSLAHGVYPKAIGREEEWLAERMAVRWGGVSRQAQQTADGRWLRIEERRTADGGTVSICVDITEMKRAEAAISKSEERFRRLAVNAPDMITECRLDGTMTFVSPASLAITGFAPEELVGKTFASLMEPEDAEKVLGMCRAVFASKGKVTPWPVEFRARSKFGRLLWLECKPTFAVDRATGRFVGLTDVVRDITSRKALEADLRQARVDAESAAAIKAEFLANMSHELRTPLTSIIGFTGLATAQTDLTKLTREYIDRVSNASRALLSTVNDILDFSKLEAGQLAIKPEPVRLGKLARDTLDLFTPQAAAKDLALSLDADPFVDDIFVAIDPDRMRQVLLNLIGNAVKFTAAGGVTLRIRHDDAPGMLSVDVIDTGEGVPEEKLSCLFKRFSQIDGSLTRSNGGTGLGLAICKGLVEAMGGEIGVKSTRGKGTRFYFRVPARRVDTLQIEGQPAEVEPVTCAGVRILVADDHPLNRELARLILIGVGAEVTEAADGEKAVALAAECPFDVILLDIHMPRLDGFGALERIRASQGPNDATPILAFTADGETIRQSRIGQSEFQGIVEKPLTPSLLIAAIARATAFAPDSISPEIANAG